MKAIVLHEYGGPEKLSYEDVADPVAGAGQVLVRVTSTSVNPIDFKLRSGAMKAFMPLTFPAILGNDFSGLVREVGSGVAGFAAGDRVMGVADSSDAELVAANADAMIKIPEGLDTVEAAALPVVTMTGEQLVTRGTGIQKGQTVLVTGALGSVGRSAVWTAKKAGAVVIAGVRGSQINAAAELGADQVLALDDAAAMEKLGFIDAVADTVGGPTAEKLLGKVKPGGVFASVVGGPANAKLHPTIRVESVVMHPDTAALKSLAGDIAAGRFVIPIDRMVPLEEAGQAQTAAEKGGIGKILLLA
ncbi:NADPH:quinone reductase-like Zn-dependent oxidoreductase [Edaphobacter aggregans]|uniref:NADPH:quinone reductase-like Zn-dependent oxidoreductase n=1 Tax=Edaphobacter aggregans TaxID=570835 RepID=A0A3R9WH34_9BACT|nr:NADP-dependent oxidoreductase [Edaphobacter aggregans]RSL17070.1 NADPH:quinone reductase-like Zn-dependent oxidoreductase [Edaphobacter aggregans]